MKAFDVLTNNFGDMSNFDRLFYKFLNTYEPTYHEYEGAVPATLTFNGDALQLCIIYGDMIQSGTPTPGSPIYPSECGNLVDGDYILPVKTGVTTNINLGSTQTVRAIKKLVFDGTENNWRITGTGRMGIPLSDLPLRLTTPYCTHFIGTTAESYSNVGNGECSISVVNGSVREFGCYVSTITTLADFKTWLQQQYANGTPVTVWYVLGTSTTATVNEPLRRIGDYVDSVSVTDIPTTAGSQTFNIDTTTPPSSVYVIYY